MCRRCCFQSRLPGNPATIDIMTLVLTALPQRVNFEMPFDVDAEGFNERWWDRPIGRVRERTGEFLSLTRNGEELARAEIDRGGIDNIYVGLTPASEVVDIVFFEVRESHRLAGIGTQAINLIVKHHEGEMLIAFSEEADGFWSGIGWTHHPREDGSRHYRPLFVHDGLMPSWPVVPARVR